jgi:hypothetical protein
MDGELEQRLITRRELSALARAKARRLSERDAELLKGSVKRLTTSRRILAATVAALQPKER